MQEGMTAFGGIAPTYRIALLDKPTIIWDFHSLMLGIQMMFSFMLTDSEDVYKRQSLAYIPLSCKNDLNTDIKTV